MFATRARVCDILICCVLCCGSGVCVQCSVVMVVFFFFFQAEDGIRDAQESRGLGDVYKRQLYWLFCFMLALSYVKF